MLFCGKLEFIVHFVVGDVILISIQFTTLPKRIWANK